MDGKGRSGREAGNEELRLSGSLESGTDCEDVGLRGEGRKVLNEEGNAGEDMVRVLDIGDA